MTVSRRRFFPLAAGAYAAASLPHKAWADSSLPVGIQLYTVGADLTKDPPATAQDHLVVWHEVEGALALCNSFSVHPLLCVVPPQFHVCPCELRIQFQDLV